MRGSGVRPSTPTPRVGSQLAVEGVSCCFIPRLPPSERLPGPHCRNENTQGAARIVVQGFANFCRKAGMPKAFRLQHQPSPKTRLRDPNLGTDLYPYPIREVAKPDLSAVTHASSISSFLVLVSIGLAD